MLRLVNFAYGQLIMVGAYTLAFTSSWPLAASLLTCFAVVVAFSLLMDLVVFRPLRNQSSAVMLVTTFAIAFLLQAIALIVDLRDNFLGQVVFSSITSLNESISIGGVDVRKVTIVAVGVTLVALVIIALLLGKTTIGLHTRAAASDFRTARLLGVRANRVITFAVVISGVLAAAVAMLYGGRQSARHPRLRAAGHDHRADRGRRRRDRPAVDGDARRVRHRVRLGGDQRACFRPRARSTCRRCCSGS